MSESSNIDARIVYRYTRMPQGGEHDIDEWGDLDRMMSALATEQMTRLNEEERRAGHEPW